MMARTIESKVHITWRPEWSMTWKLHFSSCRVLPSPSTRLVIANSKSFILNISHFTSMSFIHSPCLIQWHERDRSGTFTFTLHQENGNCCDFPSWMLWCCVKCVESSWLSWVWSQKKTKSVEKLNRMRTSVGCWWIEYMHEWISMTFQIPPLLRTSTFSFPFPFNLVETLNFWRALVLIQALKSFHSNKTERWRMDDKN